MLSDLRSCARSRRIVPPCREERRVTLQSHGIRPRPLVGISARARGHPGLRRWVHERRHRHPGGHGDRRDRWRRAGPPTSPSPEAGSAASGTGLDGCTGAGRRRARSCAPGFIDIHTHYDAQVFWDPDLTPSSFHGVTTVIAGNCGFSIAPIRPDGVALLARTLQHVEDMSFDTLSAGVPWGEFETFPQYLDAVERRGRVAELRLLRRATPRCACTSWARTPTSGRRTDDEIATHAGRGGRRHGGRRGGVRLHARRRRTTATAAGRCRRGWPTWPSCGLCSSRCKQSGRAWWRCCPGGVFPNQEVFELQREVGPAVHLDGAADGEGVPVPREGDRRARRGLGRRAWRCGRRCRAGRSVFQMNLSEPFTLEHAPDASRR